MTTSERTKRRDFAAMVGVVPGPKFKLRERVALPVMNDERRAAYVNDSGEAITVLDWINASAIEVDVGQLDDELVEGVIGRNALAVIYGDTNSGKTFLAIDLAAAVALASHWFGHNVVGGVVLYLASEAPGSVVRRVAAYKREHGVALERLVVVQSPVNLYRPCGDVQAVQDLVQQVEHETGEKVVLIVGDTLAMLSAGANENAGEDMGEVLANVDRIRRATGATFLLIHHIGKNAANGMRGWSGVRAAIDTEVEVTSNDEAGLHVAEITKQRDLDGRGTRLGFRLRQVVIGCNRWGNERTTCIVEASQDVPPKVTPTATRHRKSEIVGAVFEVLRQFKAGMSRTALVKHFEGTAHDRSSIYRVVREQAALGRLVVVGGIVMLSPSAWQ